MSDAQSENVDPRQAVQLFFSSYLQLEKQARKATDLNALQFHIVNETRRVFEYRQGAMFLMDDRSSVRVAALSGIALVDPNAPFVDWLRRLLATLDREQRLVAPLTLSVEDAPATFAEDWSTWSPASGLWLPFKRRDETVFGGLWLARDSRWRDVDVAFLASLGDTYAHAWQALAGPPRLRQRLLPQRKRLMWGGALLTAAVLAFPVSQSALAPAQVIADAPEVVAAPLDGIVAGFDVEPNQPVKAGDRLFRFDDTTVRNRVRLAERALQVAVAEWKRASQGAFASADASSQVALLKARVELKQAELDYANSMLARVDVRASRDGVAIFNDPKDWIGRPVSTGERILWLADPQQVKLRVDLPVKQMMALEPEAEIVMFLDSDPLVPRQARLERASYEAQPQPDGTLAYLLHARLEPDQAPTRIGLHGTARVYARSVPLAFYLFRRPIAELRQWLGW